MQDVDYEVFYIEKNVTVYNPDEEDEYTRNCIDVPVSGIDVQWADAKN